MLKTIPIIKGRPCGSCTACCEGWLYGDAFGFEFTIGKPCKFLGGRGCSIYDLRPYSPCQTFLCHWKENTAIPEWLRPDKSNVIILKRQAGKFFYMRLIATGLLELKIYEWAQEMSTKGKHLVITEGNEIRIFSQDPEFQEALTNN